MAMEACHGIPGLLTPILTILLIVGLPPSIGNNQVKEFCLTESFSAECQKDEVIVINNAEFGRMRLGRCVTKNFGHVGCSNTVMPQLDAKCSGRHSCRFSVSDPTLVRTKPCPQDFSSYLEASYECIKVSSTPQAWCTGANFIRLEEPEGYIASITTEESGCGSIQSPWIVSVLPGQKVNITLLDFSLGLNDTGENGHNHKGPQRSSFPMYCQQFARLEEREASRSTIVCGGEARVKHVYVSVTHEVEIHVVNRRTMGKSQYFLLHYKAIGCPNIKAPPDTYSRRDGDKMFIICNHTGDTSYLTCVDTSWEGEIRNCTPATQVQVEEMVTGVGLPPVGISIVIIVGVALVVVVYVAIMIVCVMYLQRRRRRLRQANLEKSSVDCQLGDIQLIKQGDSTDGLEESVPMLAKPLTIRSNLGCVTVGEYTDVHLRGLMQPSRASFPPQDGRVGLPPEGCVPDDNNKAHSQCDCMSIYARARPLNRTKGEPIYDTSARLHKVKCPTVPNGASPYFELDAKGLHHGNKLPGPDVVNMSTCGRLSTKDANSDASESENELNRLKEQAL